ncbi:MAG TPA: ABC transporter substrate-binding protein [Solirubrobacterales bacterium]|nr:ABC transporter substrate-binding protein [Solirubrobacterales bacterium]
MYDTYIPLLTYRHASGKAGSKVIPGLARSLPKITDGGRKYVLYLRKGLRYSDGTPVRATDFERTVERMFRLYSGGFPFFADIVGAGRYLQAGRGGIQGIDADNRTGRISIRLRRPRGTFTSELATPFVALVPAGTPAHDLSADPPPATGPYEITSSQPGVGWTYEQNPEWEGNARLLPQVPGGNVDRIEVTVTRNPFAQVRALEKGQIDWIQNPPPPSLLPGIKRRYGGTQFRMEPTHSLYYFWMNTTKPPFDDIRVRRAVNYAVDAKALSRIYGGQLAPTHQILPPGMLGYRRFDLYPHSVEKARRLIALASPRDREITVWTDTESPNYEAGAYYAQVLRKLGFRVHEKVLSVDFYFSAIGRSARANLDTGWSDWFEDYPHPNDFFQPLVAGESVLPTYSSNFTQIDQPALNRRIAGLRERRRISEPGYATLDRSYMKLAPMVPYGTRLLSTFVSKRVNLDKVIWSQTFGTDIASLRFR